MNFKDIVDVEIEPMDVACDAAGGFAGLTAGLVVELVIDQLLPELSGIKNVGAQIGKWTIAGCVARVTADYTAKEAKALIEIQKETQRLTEKIMLGEDDDYDIF